LGPLTALTWALDAPLVTVMDSVTPGLMARQWPGDLALLTEPRQQFEVLHVRKDGVVRHERNLQPDCRRGYPTIGLMLLLAQAVPGSDTPGTKRGICLCQVRSWPHDLCPGISRSRRRSRSGPQLASLAGRGVVRRVLAAVDSAVVPGLGLEIGQERRHGRDGWMMVVQAEFADQHAELAVGLQLVVRRLGADVRVSPRILPPAIGPDSRREMADLVVPVRWARASCERLWLMRSARLDRHRTVHRNQIDGVPQPAQVARAQQLRFPPQTVEPPTPELGIGI
jgi:hypothetical protein